MATLSQLGRGRKYHIAQEIVCNSEKYDEDAVLRAWDYLATTDRNRLQRWQRNTLRSLEDRHMLV